MFALRFPQQRCDAVQSGISSSTFRRNVLLPLCCLLGLLFNPEMEAVLSSETSINVYQTTWRQIPEHITLQNITILSYIGCPPEISSRPTWDRARLLAQPWSTIKVRLKWRLLLFWVFRSHFSSVPGFGSITRHRHGLNYSLSEKRTLISVHEPLCQ
jgi:hypothetical protein